MLACAQRLATLGGGFVVASGGEGRITGELALPVAGLMSADPSDTDCRNLERARRAASDLGSRLACPFGTLSFLALSVIPELRITAQGLFDVLVQEFTGVEAG